ncbi:MAG: bifunctional adenosylcobinamide kinase/adenosylcobinamide-phosphate guanylyltransferase [Oscillospiraceae bacterium]|nr:bifunctional adenosylcobinamide kinase/adenosylcobinamide-phosphate guanylyltransferase [Oscillospiraceae bacterium]
MRLIIGGAGQGKLSYALRTYHCTPADVAETFSAAQTNRIFDRFHAAVRAALEAGEDPQRLTEELLEANPNVIILCDEVGCGVIPVQREERVWRETVGRLCCDLAEQAESVERVFCGLPMRLK